nr:glycosyltransferase family 4 protein [Microbacterium ulmi]
MTDADTLGALVRPKGARVVSTRHFAAPRGGSVPARVVSRLASTRIAGQIAISDFVAGRIESESVVIHTGVATVADVPSGARENAVLVLQRLEAEKFTDDALRAWSLSGARAQGWRLWIAGDGGERRRLESLAAELGIGGTTDFLGFARDTGDLYRRASVLLAPTRVEGLGLSVIEAMAHGLPVVATDAGGHRETVGPVAEAALYPAGDAAAAAEELDRLVADAALRGRYGAALRDRQRTEFTIDAQITRTLDVYRRIV